MVKEPVLVLVMVLAALAAAAVGHEHKCVHDDLQKDIPVVKSNRIRYKYEPKKDLPEHERVHVMDVASEHKEPADAEPGTHRRHINLDQVQTEGMRLIFDTTSLTSDPDRTCFPGQSRYWRGKTTPTTSSCASEVATNCWASCTADDELSQAKVAYLTDEILPAAALYFRDALLLAPVSGPLLVSTTDLTSINACSERSGCYQCGGIKVPDSLATTGKDGADMVLMVSARPTQGGVIAFAGGCITDSVGRPVVGYINFGSNMLTLACNGAAGCVDANLKNNAIATAIHEITHALGFSGSMFESYVGRSGTGYAFVTSKLQLQDDGSTHEVTVINTPAVKAAARVHYGCDTMEGLELEDGGGAGTAGSHWEKRLVHNEYMSGTASQYAVKSNLTLAIMHDTGWYTANWPAAEFLDWGFKEGCTFAHKKCSKWTTSNEMTEFYVCDVDGQPGCSHNRRVKSACKIVNYDSSPPDFWNYFGNNQGGIDEIADRCPILVPFGNGDCSVAENEITSGLGEQYTADARCFVSTAQDASQFESAANNPYVGCYRHRCVTTTQLKVKIGSIYYDCPADGGEITGMRDFHGTVKCPAAKVLCGGLKKPDRTWPSVEAIDPSAGAAEGNVTITIDGKNFASFMKVELGGTKCTDVERDGRTQLICMTGPIPLNGAKERKVSVLVTDSRGRTAFLSDAWTATLTAAAATVKVGALMLPVVALAALALLWQ